MNNPHSIKPIKPIKRIKSPRKLLHSKWTAVKPVNKEKHFLVTQLVLPDNISEPITIIELEAVHSKRSQKLSWQTLNDSAIWQQGWV